MFPIWPLVWIRKKLATFEVEIISHEQLNIFQGKSDSFNSRRHLIINFILMNIKYICIGFERLKNIDLKYP